MNLLRHFRERLKIVLLGFLLTSWTPASFAVLIAGGDGSGNTSSSGAGGGWNYVGLVNDGSGVYLGSYGGGYWVLTANHVGGGTFTVNGTPYSMVGGSGQQVAGADLYVYRIVIPGGDTNLLNLSNLSLRSTALTNGSPVTVIGYGRNRATSATNWDVDTGEDPDLWTPTGGTGDRSGFAWASGRTKRWGTNNITGSTTVNGYGVQLVTTFTDGAGGNEAQLVPGDSGGGMFYNNGGTWELAGILDLINAYNGQPAETSVYGNQSFALSIAEYRDEILAAIPEPGSFVLVGVGLVALFGCYGLKRRRLANSRP